MKSDFVQLWHGNLLHTNAEDPDYWSLLSGDEKKKAAKYVRQDLQQKYIKTRGVLRTVLASNLNTDPQRIIIKTGKHGKPFVTDQAVNFNLSHTGNKFVIVVSNCTIVGVDIEQCINRKSLSALVEKCFSDVEINYWNALPEEQKIQMFFRFWVRKEAFVKAVGRGIGLGLDLCSVNPENQNRFYSIPDGYGSTLDWKIVDIPLEKADVCAIVTKDLDFKYTQIEWK